MQLTKEERIFIVKQFHEIKRVRETIKQFWATYKKRSVAAKTVSRTVIKFEHHETVQNRNKGNLRKFTKRTQENI